MGVARWLLVRCCNLDDMLITFAGWRYIHKHPLIRSVAGIWYSWWLSLSGHISSPITLSATPGCYLGKEHPGIYEVCPHVYDVSFPFFSLSLLIPLFLL